MKPNTRFLSTLMLCGTLFLPATAGEAAEILTEHLAAHGMPAGPAREHLPGSGAVMHLQVTDILGVLEGAEQVVVAGVPEKALPPDAQELLRNPHPLLTLLGMQHFGEPLTQESVERLTGLDPRGSLALTLYLGDPRRMFILSVPARGSDTLLHALNQFLQPQELEVITFGENAALRVVSPRLKWAPELFLVKSDDMLYVCGDRSLAIALHSAPTSQRFAQDGFLSRALPVSDDQQLRLVINPAPIQPVALQLQGVAGMAKMIIRQQRPHILANLPPEAREQLEVQVCSQLGLQDLEEFAAYAECVIVATLDQVVDFLTGRLVAFEGLSISARLHGNLHEVHLQVYSQGFQAGTGTEAIPLQEVQRALDWLGPEYQTFSVVGRTSAPKDLPVLAAWVRRVQRQLDAEGLRSTGLERLAKLLSERRALPVLEHEVPWTLTVYAPLRPLPAMGDSRTLRDYLVSLDLPVWRPVKIVPARKELLEASLRTESDALNQNRALTTEFVDSFQKQRPWLNEVSRFRVDQLDHGITRYVRENAWMTRTGLFGYDQHELVNRRVYWARQVGDFVVYHRGTLGSDWLVHLEPGSATGQATGVTRLLERVPEGANRLSVSRVLVGLPDLVEWAGELESRMHSDVERYLESAQAAVANHADLAQATREIRRLRMPELVGSVNLDPETGRVYALLPSGELPLALPRPRVVPVLAGLLEDFAQKANDVGGSVVYTRREGGVWEWSAMQRWDGLTTLTRTVGNALAERYMSSLAGRRELERQLAAERDGDRAVFDEVLLRNPQWAFIPQPRPKADAKPTRPIPGRPENAGPGLVDLTDYYNASLTETWQTGGMANNSLRDLPHGVQELGGVSFDVRGLIQLTGQQAASALSVKFPEAVSGIQVGCKGARVHFLHACAWPSSPGTEVARYVVHFANGESQTIPVNYGKDVRDWWMNDMDAGEHGPEVVWRGRNHAAPDSPELGLFKTTWFNPWPDVEITAIDYQSALGPSAPFLIAITVE